MSRSHRHIAVLDPAVRIPELDSFNQLAMKAPLPLTYHLPALFGMESLANNDPGLAGIIIMGSGASVYDQLPWQEPMNQWLKTKMLAGVPTFGICYGHQLIAHLFGGKVGFLHTSQEKELGLRQVHIQPCTLWEKSQHGALVISHREHVTACPTGFSIMAKSPVVPIEGLCHDKLPIFSFQAHPEAAFGFAEHAGITAKQRIVAEDFHFGHSLMTKFMDYVARH